MFSFTPASHSAGSRQAGIRLCSLLALILLFASALELVLHEFALAVAHFLVGIACILPYLGSRSFHEGKTAIWKVSYLIFWGATIISLASTGGASSPFFAPYMIALLLSGACLFPHIPLSRVTLFCSANFLGWIAFSWIHGFDNTQALPIWVTVKETILLLVGTVAVISKFIEIRERFAEECAHQVQRLNEAQSHLAHTEKMAGVGKLVAAMAHEMAQPAQVILTASSLMRKMVRQEESRSEKIENLATQVLDASERITRLLAQLRNFSRKEPFQMQRLNAALVIRNVQSLTQYDLRWRKVSACYELVDEPLWIEGDSMRIEQILFNLINNARDASLSSEHPRVEVRAENYRGWVRISVINNGIGIPLNIQGKLFQPYFTTKDRGQGTGLGLSISAQLIEQQGGRILFSSEPDHTIFIADIPRREKPGLKIAAGAASKALLAEAFSSSPNPPESRQNF